MIFGEGGSAAPEPALEGFRRLLRAAAQAGDFDQHRQLRRVERDLDAGARRRRPGRRPPKNSTACAALVKEAMEQGALGVASSLSGPPGSWIDTDTLVAMCEVASRYGGIYSTHMRTEGRGVFESVAEAIEIGRRAQRAGGHHPPQDRRARDVGPDAGADGDHRGGAGARARTCRRTSIRIARGRTICPASFRRGRTRAASQAMIARLKDPALRPRLENEINHGIAGHELVQPLHGDRQLGRHAAGLVLESEVQAVRGQAHERGDPGDGQAGHRRAVRAAGEQQRLRADGLLPPLRGRHAVRAEAAVGLDRLGRHGGDDGRTAGARAIRIPAISARFRACSGATCARRR